MGASAGTLSPDALAKVNVRDDARAPGLAGALDRVHEHGIDDWRGGVHLTGKGPVWRWDSAQRKLVER